MQSSEQAPVIVDTSVVLRYLRDDDARLSAFAAGLIHDMDRQLLLTTVVIAESAYVMESFYRLGRQEIVSVLSALVGRENIATIPLEKDLVLRALGLCAPSRRVSFADALTWAEAVATPGSAVATADRRFPDEGIELLQP